MKTLIQKTIVAALLVLSSAPAFAMQTQAKAQPSWFKSTLWSSTTAWSLLGIGGAATLYSGYKLFKLSKPASSDADENVETSHNDANSDISPTQVESSSFCGETKPKKSKKKKEEDEYKPLYQPKDKDTSMCDLSRLDSNPRRTKGIHIDQRLKLGALATVGMWLSAFGAYSLYCNYGKK